MHKRPKRQLILSPFDKAFEIFGLLLLVAMWSLTHFHYQSLPDIIPTHFNAAGEADNFGNKTMIFTLPLIATILFVGLTYLNKFPHLFNYPSHITEEDAFMQYTNATRLMRCLKVIIVVVFGLITYRTITHAQGPSEGLGIWFSPLTLGFIYLPIVHYVIKALKNSK